MHLASPRSLLWCQYYCLGVPFPGSSSERAIMWHSALGENHGTPVSTPGASVSTVEALVKDLYPKRMTHMPHKPERLP